MRWLLVILFAGSFSLRAAVRVVLDRDTVFTGETVQFRIVCEGFRPTSVESFPAIPNLGLQPAGHGMQSQNINGQMSMSYILNYQVAAAVPGEYTIPSIQITSGAQRFRTEAARLKVTSAPPEAGTAEAFTRLIVSKTNVYVGEVFPIEIQVFVTNADQLQLPILKGDGYIIQKQAPYAEARTQVRDKLYRVLSFKSSVSAAKAGDLVIGPAETSFNLLVRQSNDAFDFFGRNFIRKPMTVQSDSHLLQVRALPATNVPPGFSGGIGMFAMNVEAAPVTVTAGDPITLKITLAGSGNLDALQLPKFNWPGFRFYDPTAEVASTDPLGIQGTKTFEQVVVPESAAVTAIPEIQFAFFDPAQQRYRTLSRSAIQLAVKPGAQVSSSPVPATPSSAASGPVETSPQRDIVQIKTDPGAIIAWNAPSLFPPWVWAAQSVPLIAFLAAWCYRTRREKLLNNPRLRRRLETEKFVERSLQELEGFARAGDSDQFYSLLFRILQEQIGERVNLPSPAITEAALETELASKAPGELIEDLHDLFKQCSQARYAPGGIGGHLEQLLPKVRAAIQGLRKLAL